MKRSNDSLIMLLTLALASMAVACGGGGKNAAAQGSKNGFNPPPPTPGTPNPAYVPQSLDDAIAKATNELIGNTGDRAIASHVQSLAYVQTTARQALRLLHQWSDTALPIANNTAWLFVERGTFQHRGFKNATPGPIKHTLWVLAIQGYPVVNSSGGGDDDQPVDLTQLGTPTVIPPGQVPQIDAVRDPGIAVGAPSLVGGNVQVPVTMTGTGLAPYTGFNIHLRWDPAVFSFSSANTTGGVLPGSLLCPGAIPDGDGAGVVYACTTLAGAQTTSAGLLATVALTPAAAGCSALHLFTYGGADAGTDSTGTYTIDVNAAVAVTTTADGSSNVSGHVC